MNNTQVVETLSSIRKALQQQLNELNRVIEHLTPSMPSMPSMPLTPEITLAEKTDLELASEAMDKAMEDVLNGIELPVTEAPATPLATTPLATTPLATTPLLPTVEALKPGRVYYADRPPIIEEVITWDSKEYVVTWVGPFTDGGNSCNFRAKSKEMYKRSGKPFQFVYCFRK